LFHLQRQTYSLAFENEYLPYRQWQSNVSAQADDVAQGAAINFSNWYLDRSQAGLGGGQASHAPKLCAKRRTSEYRSTLPRFCSVSMACTSLIHIISS
jgi:hypothetical protein